jgi:hypothetical protein
VEARPKPNPEKDRPVSATFSSGSNSSASSRPGGLREAALFPASSSSSSGSCRRGAKEKAGLGFSLAGELCPKGVAFPKGLEVEVEEGAKVAGLAENEPKAEGVVPLDAANEPKAEPLLSAVSD